MASTFHVIALQRNDNMQLKKGDKITWSDPDNGICSKTGRIKNINYKGDIISVLWQDGSLTEMLGKEITYFKKDKKNALK